MAKMKDSLLNNLIDSIEKVTEAESDIYDYCSNLDEIQNKIRDIEHYLENHIISRSGAIELISLLQQLRIERRQIKQMWELWNTYGLNKDKLKTKEWRGFLVQELHKKDNQLQTEYNYRAFTEDYLNELNEDKPLPRGRKKNLVSSYNNIEEEKDEENETTEV